VNRVFATLTYPPPSRGRSNPVARDITHTFYRTIKRDEHNKHHQQKLGSIDPNIKHTAGRRKR